MYIQMWMHARNQVWCKKEMFRFAWIHLFSYTELPSTRGSCERDLLRASPISPSICLLPSYVCVCVRVRHFGI